MPWNPDLYHNFQAERFAPFDDLFRLIKVRDGMRVIDLGCGTGELTSRLADRLPQSVVLGIDSSEEMLSRAQSLTRPGLRFEKLSIEDVSGRWDLVFSHAAIQWVDDHEALVPRLLSLVESRGQLTVQLPSNHNHPSHVIMRELADEEPFRSALNGWSRVSPVLSIARYAELLNQHHGRDLTVYEKVYPHVLKDSDEIATWVSSTALIPYLDRLIEPQREEFLQRYRERLKEVWPEGPLFYGFQRILFSAVHPPKARQR